MPVVIIVTVISVSGLGHRFFGCRHQFITDLITNHPMVTPAITHRLIIHAIIVNENGCLATGSGIAIGVDGSGSPVIDDGAIRNWSLSNWSLIIRFLKKWRQAYT